MTETESETLMIGGLSLSLVEMLEKEKMREEAASYNYPLPGGPAPSSEKPQSLLEELSHRANSVLNDAEGVLKRLNSIANDVFGPQPPSSMTTGDKTIADSANNIKPSRISALGKQLAQMERLIQNIHTEINRFERL